MSFVIDCLAENSLFLEKLHLPFFSTRRPNICSVIVVGSAFEKYETTPNVHFLN